MTNALDAFIVLTTLAALASVALALLAVSRAQVPGAPYLAATMASVALWCGAYVAELTSASLDGKVLWAKVAYLGIVCLPPSWLLFCVSYLGVLPRRSRLAGVLCYLLPAATLVFVVLAVRVPLVWSGVRLVSSGGLQALVVDHGLWFWVHTAYSYVCLLGGSVLLLVGVFRRVRMLSAQVVIIALAAVLPWMTNALTIFRLVPVDNLDLTPPAFVVSTTLITIGLLRLQMLDVFPGMVSIARDTVVQEMQDGVMVMDVRGRVLSANRSAGQLLNKARNALAGRLLAELLDERGAEVGVLSDLDAVAGRDDEVRFSLGHDDGASRFVDIVVSRLGSPEHPRGYVLVMRDVTERVAATQALQASEERLRVLFEQSPVAVLVFDTSLMVTECNSFLAEIVGFEREAFIGLRLTAENVLSMAALCEAALQGRQSSYNGPFSVREGVERWLQCEVSPLRSATGVSGGILVAWDLTDAKQAEALIERLAFHDSLTELPNRSLFIDRLRQAISDAERDGRLVVVGLLDLDRFKNVNDAVGHSAADGLLRGLAQRLRAVARRSDTLARVGGDQFALVMAGVEDVGGALAIGEKILASVRREWQLAGCTFGVTGSIGMSIYPSDGGDAETLFENAERAMRRAKEGGGDREEFYDLSMNIKAAERLEMEHALRAALAEDQLITYYQPQVDLRNGRISGVEALVRWQHPERGLVPPAEFIPIAEETGLIGSIDEWVLRCACRQLVSYKLADGRSPGISVNVSPRHLHSPTLVATVRAALSESGLPPQLLEIELTETAVISDVEASCRVLEELRELGVGVALDDFGTGYASLSHLHRLPIDRVKIDRSFVSRVEEDEQAASIVSALVGLAQSLHLGTVAEGVETQGQVAFLQSLGCDHAQGFLFARPAPADECAAFLNKQVLFADSAKQ